MTVRVLRLLEYVYDSYEIAEEDMTHWAVPQFGSQRFGPNKIVYSAILPPTTELLKEQRDMEQKGAE